MRKIETDALTVINVPPIVAGRVTAAPVELFLIVRISPAVALIRPRLVIEESVASVPLRVVVRAVPFMNAANWLGRLTEMTKKTA